MIEFMWKYGWLIAIGLQLVIAWIGWSARTGFVTADKLRQEFEARDNARNEMMMRLIRAEAEIEDKPTAKALHELALAITEFGGDMKGLVARMDGIADVVDRLERVADRQETYLLNNKGNT